MFVFLALVFVSLLGSVSVIVGALVYGDQRLTPFGFGMFIAAQVAAYALRADWLVTSVVALVALGVSIDRVAGLFPWRLRFVRYQGRRYRLDVDRLPMS